MLPDIQAQYNSLTLKFEALLQRLDSLTGETLSFKAGPDKWSIVEVVEHLVIAEKGLLEQLSTNIPVSSLDPEAKTPAKHQTVIKVMERDIEVDVPHASLEPRGNIALEDLRPVLRILDVVLLRFGAARLEPCRPFAKSCRACWLK